LANKLRIVVCLTTKHNDYQLEQANSARTAAARLGIDLDIIDADNDAVNQAQQLVKIIQDRDHHTDAIMVEPVGTPMPQVAEAAIAAGIGWVILNREADYIPALRRSAKVPVFMVSPDQEEVGRIQGQQLAALVRAGNILYIEGPSNSSTSGLRARGLFATKPAAIEVKIFKGDWSEARAYHAVQSWLALSTSKQLNIQAVVCQNDTMAIGARKAFVEHANGDESLPIPFLGADGVSTTAQDWVRRGLLRATVVIPPVSGKALEMFATALTANTMPPEQTLCPNQSFPSLAELSAGK
jgi:ribose transport system substrate-binding protein